MTKGIKILILFFCFVIITPSFANEAKEYNLNDLLALSKINNAEIKIAEGRLKVSRLKCDEATAKYSPNLLLTSGHLNAYQDLSLTRSLVENNFSRSPFSPNINSYISDLVVSGSDTNGYSALTDLRLSKTLFNWQIKYDVELAKKSWELQKVKYNAAIQDISGTIVKAYFDLLLQHSKQAALRKKVEILEAVSKEKEDDYKEGRVSSLDFEESLLNLNIAKRSLDTVGFDISSLKEELASFVWNDSSNDFTISSNLNFIDNCPFVSSLEVVSLRGKLENNTEIQQLKLNEDINGLNQIKIEGNNRPNIDIIGGVNAFNLLKNLSDSYKYLNAKFYLGFNIQWTLLDFGKSLSQNNVRAGQNIVDEELLKNKMNMFKLVALWNKKFHRAFFF